VTSGGGKYRFKDDQETPDTHVVTYEFGDKAITWEGRSCNNNPLEGAERGFIIYGDKGTLVNGGGDDYKIFDLDNQLVREMKSDVKPDPTNPVTANGNLDLFHFDNFIKSVKGEASVNSPMNEAHKSVLLCHLANISQRTGTALHCNPSNGLIKDNQEAMALWRRTYENDWEPSV